LPTRSLATRIERLEQSATDRLKFSADCICFPDKEPPFISWPIEYALAARVKCPFHGDRFKPRALIYVSKWLREKQAKHLWSAHSEQYRKAWFASFPPELWPAEEEEMDAGKVLLRLKDGTRLVVDEPDYGKPKGDPDECRRAHS
jgi:hypothetical protein